MGGYDPSLLKCTTKPVFEGRVGCRGGRLAGVSNGGLGRVGGREGWGRGRGVGVTVRALREGVGTDKKKRT